MASSTEKPLPPNPGPPPRADASAPGRHPVAALLKTLEEMDGEAALALGFDTLDALYQAVLSMRERACGAELAAAAADFSPAHLAAFLQARARRESLPVGAPLAGAAAREMAGKIVAMEARDADAQTVAAAAAGMVPSGAGDGAAMNAATLAPTIRAAAEDVVAAKRARRREKAAQDESAGAPDPPPISEPKREPEPAPGPEPAAAAEDDGLEWKTLAGPGGARILTAEVEGVGKYWITSEGAAPGMSLFPEDGADLTHWEDAGDVAELKRRAAAHLRRLRRGKDR